MCDINQRTGPLRLTECSSGRVNSADNEDEVIEIIVSSAMQPWREDLFSSEVSTPNLAQMERIPYKGPRI